MISDQLRRVPFGAGISGVVVALVIALILVFAYVQHPGLTRGAFALGALALFGRQFLALRSRRRRGGYEPQ